MRIVNLLIKKIEESEVNDSLEFAYFLGELLFYNEIPLFDMSSIEESLIERVFCDKKFVFNGNNSCDEFLFVVTEPYSTGGHTRLMENLSLMVDDEKHLLITKGADRNTKERLSGFFTITHECYRSSKEKPVMFIERLVEKILVYHTVVLNIHPEDVFTVVACGIAKKINKNLKIHFVNHADHCFSFGATVADFWFEISLYGREVDKLRNLKGRSSFIGIPLNRSDEDFFKTINYPKSVSIKKVFTAGSGVKYKPCFNKEIFTLIDSVLRVSKGIKVEVIGVRLFKDYWWWPLKLRFFRKLHLHKSLPYEKYVEVTNMADCYIDSHPMPGGTAFVEQFIQGIPCIGLKSDFFGYTPLEKIKKNTVAEVIEMLEFPPKSKEVAEIQTLVFEVHGFSKVKNRFLNTVNKGEVFKNPMIDYIESQGLRAANGNKISLSINFLSFLFDFDKFFYFKVIALSRPLMIIKLPASKSYHTLMKYKRFKF